MSEREEELADPCPPQDTVSFWKAVAKPAALRKGTMPSEELNTYLLI